MEIFYKYDQDTGEYLGEVEGHIDPLGDGTEILQPGSSTSIKPVEREGVVPVFNKTTGKWDYAGDVQGMYLLEIATKQLVEINNKYLPKIPEGHILLDQDMAYKYMADTDRYEVNRDKLKDISRTARYRNKQKLTNIEKKIDSIKADYEDAMNETLVEYKERMFYLHKLSDYKEIISEDDIMNSTGITAFPVLIYDYSGLDINAIYLERNELDELVTSMICKKNELAAKKREDISKQLELKIKLEKELL